MMCKVLIFGCISVAMLMTTAYGASLSSEKLQILPTLIKDLEILDKIKNMISRDLYTPNKTQECSQQTLQCYLKEMVTLEKEIEDNSKIEQEVPNALKNIKKNLQRLTDQIPIEGECNIRCEDNKEKNVPEFLQELTDFLRFMQKISN